jgi:hypothetical protein
MGGLNNSFQDAGSAAQGSLQMQGASNALNFFGGISSSIGQYQMDQYKSQVAKNNAAIEEANATRSIYTNMLNESNEKTRTGILVGKEKAAQGANGIDVNSGSAKQVRDSTENLSAMDIAMMHFNAANEAQAYRQKAASSRAQAGLNSMAAANDLVGGVMKAGSSLISGASSLSSKWAQLKLSGASAPDLLEGVY